MSEHRIFLGMPSHAHAAGGAYRGLYCYPARLHKVTVTETRGSLLAHVFNLLWTGAVNGWREGKFTHFAMLHADIEPAPWWLDALAREMDAHGADVVSCVVPIKDDAGLTSTALGDPADEWAPARRLAMREVVSLPLTFSAADVDPSRVLLTNTGCWLARLGAWSEEACFTVRDRVVRRADGSLEAQTIPEDWAFARWAWRRGLKVVATRAVPLEHVGPWGWTNQHAWGTKDTDD